MKGFGEGGERAGEHGDDSMKGVGHKKQPPDLGRGMSDDQRWDYFGRSGNYDYLTRDQRRILEDADYAAKKGVKTEIGDNSSRKRYPQDRDANRSDGHVLTEEGRPIEYSQTGDRTILTPGQVEWLDDRLIDEDKGPLLFHNDPRFAEFGVDYSKIGPDQPKETLNQLIGLLKRTPDHYGDRFEAKEFAYYFLEDCIRENPEGFVAEFARTIDPIALSDQFVQVELLKLFTDALHTWRVDRTVSTEQRYRFDKALDDLILTTSRALESPDTRVLLGLRCKQELALARIVDERERYKTFMESWDTHVVQIAKGEYGVFTEDGNRLYVIGEKYKSRAAHAIQGNSTEDIYDFTNEMMDANLPLGAQFVRSKLGVTELEDARMTEYIDDYHFLVSKQGREAVEQTFSVKINELPFREQFYLVNYLKRIKQGVLTEASQFFEHFGNDGIRTFLALDEDESLGDTILEIGEKLDETTARKLFSKYAEIVDASEETREYAAEALKEGATQETEAYVHAIAKNLRHKANDLLRDARTAITTENVEPLLKKLDAIKAENLLWAATFREFSRAGVPIEDFKNTALEVETGAELSNKPEMLARMQSLLQHNYAHYNNPEFEEAVLLGLMEHVNDPATRFYLLQHKEELAGFCRFDEVRDKQTDELKELYFGSFNVERMQFGGNGVGNAILKAAFEREGTRGVPIRAHCDPRAIISQKYIEWGFVAEQWADYPGGMRAWEIVHHPDQVFQAKNMSKEEIVILADRDQTEGVVVRACNKQDFPATLPDMSLLEQGYALVRYFDDGNRVYAAFEKPSHQSQ